MQPSISFSHSIERIQKSLKRSKFKRFLLLSLLFSLLFTCITFPVFRILLTKPSNSLPFTAPLAFGVISSLAFMKLKRQRLTDVLIDLDSRYQFKELLSTAYEYHTSNKESVFTRSLLQEASSALNSLNDKQIRQQGIMPVYIALTGLTGLSVVLLFIVPLLLKPTPVDPGLNYLATRMEEFTNKQPIRIFREENKHGSEIFAELRKLAQRIKTQSIEQGSVNSSVASLKEQVSRKRSQIVDRLNQQLQAVKIPMGNALDEDEITTQELVKLVEGYFEDGLPDDLQEQLDDLEQYNLTADFLDQMSDELKDLYDSLPKLKQRRNEAIDDKHADKTDKEKTMSDKQSKSGDQNNTMGSRGGSENNNDMLSDQLAENESEEDFNQFSSAGNNKSTGKQNDTLDIAASKRQPELLRSDRGDGDWTDIDIRSSTAIGEVKMKQRLVIRDYQKDLTNSLLKERLPRKHQQTIKNYFLQIGLDGGKEQNGATD